MKLCEELILTVETRYDIGLGMAVSSRDPNQPHATGLFE